MKNSGFTLLEVLIATVIITCVVVMTIAFSSVMNKNSNLTRNISTKNRVLSSVRDFAGIPATLRASMRASTHGASGDIPINPELLACAGGNPPNACHSGEEHAFTMFSPIIARDPAGNILGVQAVSAPWDSPTPIRIDSFGSPCTTPSRECPFIIYTKMKAQCGPPPKGAAPPTNTDLAPQATCTVADVIEVIYSVKLDPSLSTNDPELASFIVPVEGSVVVPVVAISGNVPQ